MASGERYPLRVASTSGGSNVSPKVFLPGQHAAIAFRFVRVFVSIRRIEGIVNLSSGGMLPRSVARWFGAGKSLARL
jgi:hypothetical protein